MFTQSQRQWLADRIYGCWMGKNCGGTLGGPLERAWGQEEPWDVWWYPKLQQGGIPNDDLEMQLIWLKALEEVGPQLNSHHLSQYWLSHIMYNPDEYGLCKTNLRLGLLPPVAGNYNNWFKDCMGCPIRTEIWACIAPGHPRLAVRYAYEDSIVDHAGGESIWGAFFNAAIESAAFVVSNRDQLIEIGLSYVPENTRTRAAIQAAVDAHRAGVADWREARRRVMAAAPHYVAQYSPINIGFQVLGWLYGADFGDALCKTVNCGYDTDCTGATLGAYFGILLGRRSLPQRWTAPLGETIATSEPTDGLRHVSTNPNPVPQTLDELTDRTLRMAEKVLAYHGAPLVTADTVKSADLYSDEGVWKLARQSPTTISFPDPTIDVAVDYLDTPAVHPGQTKPLCITLRNPHPEAVEVSLHWKAPQDWPAIRPAALCIGPQESIEQGFDIPIPPPQFLENSNELLLQLQVADRPAVRAVPIRLIGASRWRISELYPLNGRIDHQAFDATEEPLHPAADLLSPAGRPGRWTEQSSLDNTVPAHSSAPGTIFAQTFLHSHNAREIWLGLAANCPAKVFVNGELSTPQFMYRPLRPNYDGGHDGKQQTYGPAQVRQGGNEVLIQFTRGPDAPPFQAHLMVCEKEWHRGATTLGRTRFPWD